MRLVLDEQKVESDDLRHPTHGFFWGEIRVLLIHRNFQDVRDAANQVGARSNQLPGNADTVK